MAELLSKFLRGLLPLLRLNQALGLATFNFSHGELHSSISLKCYSVLLLILFNAAVAWTFSSTAASEVPTVFKTLAFIQLLSSFAVITVIWVNSIIRWKRFVTFVTELVEWDRRLLCFGYEIDYNKSFNYVAYTTAIKGILIAVSTYWYWRVIDQRHIYIKIIYEYLLIVSTVFCQQIIVVVKILRARFQNLSRILSVNVTLTALNRVISLHHQLAKIVKLFNEMYGLALLAIFCAVFVNVTLGLYFWFLITYSLNFGKIYLLGLCDALFIIGCYSLDAFLICNACQATVKEANKSKDLANRIQNEDCKFTERLIMFSLQTGNEPMEFSAYGFFPVNHTLLFSIIGAVSTYITILIQLSPYRGDEHTFSFNRNVSNV